MAKAPSSSKAKKTTTKTTSKPAPKSAAKKASSTVEDAVVIEETAPAPAAKATKAEAKPETPAKAAPTKAEPKSTAKAASDAPAAPKQAEKPVNTSANNSTTKPDATPDTKPAPPTRKKGGAGAFFGFVTGGLLAAVIGFGAARYVVPEGWPFPGVAPKEDPVAAAVEAQAGEITTLAGQVSDNASAIAAVQTAVQAADAVGALRTEIEAKLAETGGAIDAATARLAEIDTRLAAVEKMAPEGSAAAAAAAQAYDRELTNLREMFQGELDTIKAAQADAAALQAQAAEAERAAAGRAAMSQVTAALDNGRPFAEPLAEMTAATGIEVPASLSAAAQAGVTTLAALQESFAPAARAALDAATKAAAEDGSISKWQAFVQGQLGTRSLEPREGDDADAVLSRAEAALRQGQLEATLTELAALPEAAQAPMADWRADAQTRLDALTAGAMLAQDLNAK